MAQTTIRALLIEDNPADVLFVQAALEQDPLSAFDLASAERLCQGMARLQQQPFDVLLLDLGLPDSQGLATFERVHHLAPDLPVVVLSGLVDEQIAVQAVQAGAQDYLVKGPAGWDLLARAIRYAIERQQARAALRASERHFRALIEHSSDGVALLSADGMIVYESPSIARILDQPPEAMVGRSAFAFLHPDDQAASADLFGQLLHQPRASVTGQFRYPHSDGTWHWIEATGANLLDEPSVHAIVVNYRDITERKRAEAALRESETRLQLAQRCAHLGYIDIDIHTQDVFWADETFRLLGYAPQAFTPTHQHFFERVHPDDVEMLRSEIEQLLTPSRSSQSEYRIVRPDGEVRWMYGRGEAVLDDNGRPLRLISILLDITERKRAEVTQLRLEAELRQAQKMESIGRLAGGVAHDFNNLLTVIQGYCDFMQESLPIDHPLREDLVQIQQASERGTALTRQLLAFGRKQILAPTILDLNALVGNLRKMLERLIGEDIALTTALQPDLWRVTADPGQIEQVLMNLAVNARDAMPTGGSLTIETRTVPFDDGDARMHAAMPTGPCVLVAISDTGCGMDDATRSRIFEPFFTTKAPGQGTGLGLATVYGIVTQSGGTIAVDSAPGRGSTFKIFLPASATAASDPASTPSYAGARGGHETILLVEDEAGVRHLARAALHAKGYTILAARDGGEALSVAEQHAGPIDILVTDVVMPRMSGRVLAERLVARRPRLKILFMSGYTDDTVIRHGLLTDRIAFLPKPFTPGTLTAKVREVLDT